MDSGPPDPTTTNGTTTGSISNFTVKYSQTFDHMGKYVDLALPGARLMVYYAAFYVDITSKTYKYPIKVKITYDDSSTPYVSSGCTVNPDNVVSYTSGPVTVDVTIGPAKMNNPWATETISAWQFQVSYSGGKGAQQYNNITSSASGGSKTFTLFISAADIDLSSQSSQTININTMTRAKFTNGGSRELALNCTVTITKDNQAPTPTPSATPTPTPTPTPPTCNTPPTANIVGPSTAKQGDDAYFSGFGSKQHNGGTNLSYQWYYALKTPDGNFGQLVTGPSGRDVSINFTDLGTYNVWLGVVDLNNSICSASTYTSITIGPPGPDAAFIVTGDRKEKRPLVLDGSTSTSPVSYPIVDSTRTWTITAVSGGTASDIVTIGAYTGTKKLDVMFRKPGDYKITYTVTNTKGLSSTATQTITIVKDEAPVAVLNTADRLYRDPDHGNKVVFNLNSDSYSPDGDMLSTSDISAIYDSNNNGSFIDEADTNPVSMNMITGKGVAEAVYVGHYLFAFRVRETFDPGPFAAYIHDSDYQWSDVAFAPAEVDNQAPTTSLTASKEYKADIYVNIGTLPAADQNFIRNNIQNLKTTLKANQVDANIKVDQWDTSAESDYLIDSNTKLNHDIVWRNPVDQKYFVGITNSMTEQGTVGAPLATMNLKMLPVFNPPSNASNQGYAMLPKVGRTPYILLDTRDYDNKTYTHLYVGNSDYGVMAYPNSGGWPYYSNAGMQLDTLGNPYVFRIEEYNSGDPFRHNYRMMYSSAGSFDMPGTFNNLNQIIGKLSYVNNEWTIWTAEGLYWIDVYQQNRNYWRKSSNGFIPVENPPGSGNSPDIYTGGSSVDTYVEGYQVSGDAYWFGAQGSQYDTYLVMHYKYTWATTPLSSYGPTIYGSQINGNTIAIVVVAKSGGYAKLTITNGVVTKEEKLPGIPTAGAQKFNLNSNKAYSYTSTYVDGAQRYQVTEYDMTTKQVAWTKLTDEGITIVDIGFDYDGATPIYLFRSNLSNALYLSRENDATQSGNNLMFPMTTRTINASSVSYNVYGAYSWVDYTNAFAGNKGSVTRVNKVDTTGKYTYKSVPYADGTQLMATYTYKDGTVVVFGVSGNRMFYGLDSEKYAQHDLGNMSIYCNVLSGNGGKKCLLPFAEDSGLLYLTTNEGSGFYTFNRDTGVMTKLPQNGSGMAYAYDRGTIKTLISKPFTYYGSTYLGFNAAGSLIKTSIDAANYTSYSYIRSSMDIDASGNVAAVVTLPDSGGRYTSFFTTSLSEFQPYFAQSNGGWYGSLGQFYNYSDVKVKLIGGKIYFYAYDGSMTKIYRLSLITSGSTPVYYSVTLTQTDFIQNNRPIEGFVADTLNVFSAGFTNLQGAKPEPKSSAFLSSQNVNGIDEMLFGAGVMKGNGYGSRNYDYLNFDPNTGGFARASKEYNVNNKLDFAFYDKTSNQYRNVPFYFDANSSYFLGTYNYRSSTYTFPMQSYSNGVYTGFTFYRANKNGVTQLYTLPNTINGQNVTPLGAVQDDEGYTYIAYVTAAGNGSYQYYLTHNRGGSYTAMAIYPNVTSYYSCKTITYSSGKLILPCRGSNGKWQFNYWDAKSLSAYPGYKQVSTFGYDTSIYDFNNVTYKDGEFYAMATVSYWYQDSEDYGYTIEYQTLVSTMPTNFEMTTVVSYLVDDYDLYVATTNRLYRFNKSDMSLLDASKDNISNGFVMKAKGKVATYSYDGGTKKATIKIVNAIDMSQNDPNFINTVGGRNIRTIFSGSPSIKPSVDPIIAESNGTFVDYTTPASTLDAIASYIMADVKHANGGSGVSYFLLGDTVNFKGSYFDYETDPMQDSNYTFTHDPSVYDNNQGLLPGSGQSVAVPLTQLNKVGKYEVYFRAKDDPTAGRTALQPYAKWSAIPDHPLMFYVHRKPIAHFSVLLRDSPSNAMQALATITEDSYDLDHSVTLAAMTKGIAAKHWKWKIASDTEWTDGPLLSMLAKNTTYVLSLTVTDLEGADSEPYTLTFDTGPANITPNRPPVVNITDPASADPANPTIVNSLTPTYQWTFTDPDNDPQVKYEVYVYNSGGTLIYDSGWRTSSALTHLMPGGYLSDGQTYSVQVKGNDGYADSALAAKKYFKVVLNNPPVADVIDPSGTTKATATMVSTTTPTIKWSQTDPDPGTVFKSYEVQITNEANTQTWTSAGWSSNVAATSSGTIAQNTTMATQSWAVPITMPLAGGQYYRVRVRVQDDHAAWSNWSSLKWMYVNRPPIAEFDWTPKPVWEGDTLAIASMSSDPDGDPLTYAWSIVKPDGSTQTSAALTVTFPFAAPGNYRVTLTVSDSRATVSTTKTIVVQPLTIQSDVKHTAEWLANHEALGHRTTGRPKDFYSGEIFVVETVSAPAPVIEATASLQATGADDTPIDISATLQPDVTGHRFAGELFDEQLQSMTQGLPKGLHAIHFRIRYANGVVKEEDVPINIIGNVNEYVGVHRVR